tara:strand:+ start:18075 stop:18248 length:174 start_codon:yes stop_codon:yes gene_type:complete
MMRKIFNFFSEWSDYLSGMLLGAILGGYVVYQARGDEIAEIHADHRERIEAMISEDR